MKYNEMAIKLVGDLTAKDRSGIIDWSVMWLDDVRQRGHRDHSVYISGEIAVSGNPMYWSIYWPVDLMQECWDNLIDRTIDGANWALIGLEGERP